MGWFFAFLAESGIQAHWQTLTIAGVRHLFVPVLACVLLYGMRLLFGIASRNALPALLFSNVAAMTLIGFNAHQVTAGLSSRGAKQQTLSAISRIEQIAQIRIEQITQLELR